jgi:membrane-bound inhibitor of C-type lysozyme
MRSSSSNREAAGRAAIAGRGPPAPRRLGLFVALAFPAALWAQEPAPLAVAMDCGGAEIAVGYAGEAARLRMGDREWDLRQVRTASGAKYEDPEDPGTFIWSKGRSARVSVEGVELAACVEAEGTTVVE